ncbi:glutathione peroxidase [Aphelenchoides avenae]|nr:glutathione peroxidase [Aphelenchus avenae]
MASALLEKDRTIYQFKARDIDGKEVSLDKYKGKPLLCVNVASECKFTDKNYSQLRKTLEKYKDKGLSIAAFPCNQFGKLEPGSPEEIKKFVQEKYKFHPDLFEKIDVNEANAHPLYSFLKNSQGIDNIEWNFFKFLVDKNGRPVKAYRPDTDPKEVEADIEKLI